MIKSQKLPLQKFHKLLTNSFIPFTRPSVRPSVYPLVCFAWSTKIYFTKYWALTDKAYEKRTTAHAYSKHYANLE